MPRPPPPPATALAVAIQEQRQGRSLREVGSEIGVPNTTLSALERGIHTPSLPTARALARWLGWTLEEVFTAAEEPPTPPAPTSSRSDTSATRR